MVDNSPTTGGGTTGATMLPEYMGRVMKCYPVHEFEIETLATLNTESTIFFSVSSASLAFAVGIWTNAAFADVVTPAAQLASTVAAPTLAFLAVVFLGLGAYTVWRRSNLWGRIKREAVTLQASPV